MEVRQTNVFSQWLLDLRDRAARARIVVRIRRLEQDNPGDVKAVGEMRITYGPGYRLYFIRQGEDVTILLCGGDKSTQAADIAKAKLLAKEV
jgi:putative addiction module killer protein